MEPSISKHSIIDIEGMKLREAREVISTGIVFILLLQ